MSLGEAQNQAGKWPMALGWCPRGPRLRPRTLQGDRRTVTPVKWRPQSHVLRYFARIAPLIGRGSFDSAASGRSAQDDIGSFARG